MATPATNQRPGGGQTKMCQFKLVLLGESAVGKSSLVLRFVKGQFHEYQESTIGGMYHYASRDRYCHCIVLGANAYRCVL